MRRPAILTWDWWWNAPTSERYSPLNPSGASYITTTYGRPDAERILPTWQGYVAQGYQGNPIVFAAIGARLALFSEATLKFRNLADKHLFGGPELSVLEQPWPNGTTGELLARLIQDADLAGNAYIRRTDTGLERLRPDQVTIISELVPDALGRPYRVPVGYYHEPDPTETDREPALYTADEVCHWSPVPDPQATFRGMSWLTPIVRELEADHGLTTYKTRYLENAATPNLLIKWPADTRPTQPQLDSMAAMVAARHGGVDNAFRTMLLEGGADVTVIGNNLEQMNFSTVQAAGENRILVASGVPGIVVGSKEGLEAATYSNYAQAMRRFADVTMRPTWRSACAALASLVAVPPGAQLWYDTSDIAALQEGEKERADTMLVRATSAEMLLRAGYLPDSVTRAIDSGDLNLLQHSGLYSVQLQPPGSVQPTEEPTAPSAAVSTQDPNPEGGQQS